MVIKPHDVKKITYEATGICHSGPACAGLHSGVNPVNKFGQVFLTRPLCIFSFVVRAFRPAFSSVIPAQAGIQSYLIGRCFTILLIRELLGVLLFFDKFIYCFYSVMVQDKT